MSENTQVQSDAVTEQVQSDVVQTQQTEEITVNRSAEELAKRLKEVSAEARENRKRAVEANRKREDSEKAALAQSGQFKELAEVWQRKAQEAESKSEKLFQAFSMKAISDSVQLEAQKLGCVDPEALINLINMNDLPLSEDFTVDKNHVKAVLEDMRKQKPYFFQKAAPRVLDVTPAKNEPLKQDLTKMTLADRVALLVQLKNQGK